jgi:dTMP kinase
MASRAQLVEEKIEPLLKKGINVVCDRYIYSSVIYQGYALGIGQNKVLKIGETAVKGIYPNLVILLDINPKTASIRTKRFDRIEKRGFSYQKNVRLGFLRLARKFKKRFVVIDGSGGISDIHKEIKRIAKDVI